MKDSNEEDKRPPRVLPKKKYGQHFLTDKNLLKKIVRAAGVAGGDTVLEIGPGAGALTECLLEAGAGVIAVEVDTALCSLLRERFSSYGGFELIEKDALKVSFLELSKGRGARLKAVSNLPYNISGPVLSKFIRERAAFTLLVLMFQKEVARRIAAGPGTKDYGVLSVLSQVYAEVKIEFDVSRNLFKPRPKVDSSVVSLKILDEPKVPVVDEAHFKAVVRSAFGTRRKMLSNALKTMGMEREKTAAALEACGIDPQRRGETLSLKEFSSLADALYRVSH